MAAPQADGGVDGAQPPHRVIGGGGYRLALQGEEGRDGALGEQPSGMAQPRLVGHQQEHGAGARPLGEPPEPLGEARPVGGEALPDDADGPAAGQGQGGVQRHGAVPAEADGVGEVGDVRGQAVDDGQGVEALQEDAPPAGRYGTVAEQVVQGRVLVLGQPGAARRRRGGTCASGGPARSRGGRRRSAPASSSFLTAS